MFFCFELSQVLFPLTGGSARPFKVSNVHVEFDPIDNKTARVRAMVHNPMVLRWLPLTPFFTFGGWYVHVFRKVGAEWKVERLSEEMAYMDLFFTVITGMARYAFYAWIVWKLW